MAGGGGSEAVICGAPRRSGTEIVACSPLCASRPLQLTILLPRPLPGRLREAAGCCAPCLDSRRSAEAHALALSRAEASSERSTPVRKWQELPL